MHLLKWRSDSLCVGVVPRSYSPKSACVTLGYSQDQAVQGIKHRPLTYEACTLSPWTLSCPVFNALNGILLFYDLCLILFHCPRYFGGPSLTLEFWISLYTTLNLLYDSGCVFPTLFFFSFETQNQQLSIHAKDFANHVLCNEWEWFSAPDKL